MSFKLEAGQWYRNREGEICYCVGKSEAMRDQMDHWLVETATAYSDTFRQDGSFLGDTESKRDLIEHLPDCTGFDWEPPKPEPQYRPFKWEEREQLRDKIIVVTDEESVEELQVTKFTRHGNEFYIEGYESTSLLTNGKFLDGTPCGVRVDD